MQAFLSACIFFAPTLQQQHENVLLRNVIHKCFKFYLENGKGKNDNRQRTTDNSHFRDG